MIVQCSQCNKRYDLDESHLSKGAIKVRCPNCEHVSVVKVEFRTLGVKAGPTKEKDKLPERHGVPAPTFPKLLPVEDLITLRAIVGFLGEKPQFGWWGTDFLDRTLPLAGHFFEGKIEREDRLPVPPFALREILLNAVMHRDFSDPGGYVAIAVFDDRIEIRSIGRLPPGVTVEMLSRPHLSKLRNPLIAEAFHRTGAVEIWGRGTNRVIEECQRYGIDPPIFAEEGGAVVVTFRAPIGPGVEHREKVPPAELGVRAMRILTVLLEKGPLGSSALLRELGEPISQRALQNELGRLRRAGLITAMGKGRATTYRAEDKLVE